LTSIRINSGRSARLRDGVLAPHADDRLVPEFGHDPLDGHGQRRVVFDDQDFCRRARGPFHERLMSINGHCPIPGCIESPYKRLNMRPGRGIGAI
jgi:hypothetical protein